jgi:ATP-dependent helicase HrpB
MQRLPLPPRLSRIVIEARGSFEGCAAAAWLAEPTRLDGGESTSSDVLPVLDRWPWMPGHLKRVADALGQAAANVLGQARRSHVNELDLRRALLAGYPDRVAKRRSGNNITLATGHGAMLGRETGVHGADWLIALDVAAGRTTATTQALVRVASRIEPEWLLPTRSGIERELDSDTGAIKARAIDWYEELVLAERPIATDDESRSALLAAAWLERPRDEQSARLIARLAFAGLGIDLPQLVSTAASKARRLQDLVLTEELLPWDVKQRLGRLAPDRLAVPSGREMPIEYQPDGGVVVSVKLQELFGLAETPRIGPAQTPITFRLLAPNGRPVQTTQDLKSFWERTYPEVRKELRGRYPRHPWPDDPWNATPTHRAKRRV